VSTADDYAHLCRCWPVQCVNGVPKRIAEWCGWALGDTVLALEAMHREGLIGCWRPPGDQPDLTFWAAPKDASGILPLQEPDGMLAELGITRAVRNDEDRVVKYNGPPPADVESAARFRGWSISYRLVWLGPDPREAQP
jgi:hypothetical protein